MKDDQKGCSDRKDILEYRIRVAKGKEKNHFRQIAMRNLDFCKTKLPHH